MTIPSDLDARLRALTDLGATLVVEAAAGTGKTALIAGRVTMLLAEGCAPADIAAITFTEKAASELSARVYSYVTQLLIGAVPASLREVLPAGLSVAQRTSLTAARASLNELTVSTIHGFCQNIIHSYAVESNIDPGARIVDGTQQEILFDAVFNRWLRRRLTTSVVADDPIAVLSKQDPKHVVSTVRKLARFRGKHRTARCIPADLSGRPDIDFVKAVREFCECVREKNVELLQADLQRLSNFYENSFTAIPDFAALWNLAHPRRLASMRKESFDLKTPRLTAEAAAHFIRVDTCYRLLLGKLSTAIISGLSKVIDEVLHEYETFKRDAALLDFDDLLYRARDLVRNHGEVREALGKRYQRILVDEFQDTDRVQAEVLFRIASSDCPTSWVAGSLRPGSLFIVGDPKQSIYRFRGADIETYHSVRSAIQRKAPDDVLRISASFRSLPRILDHVNRCFNAPLTAEGQPGYVHLISTRERCDADLGVAKTTVHLQDRLRADEIRQAEADQVAEICARLLGNMQVKTPEGLPRPLEPSDIALLAPTGTKLWIYEQALDNRKLPFASQAGKNLFARQEVRDLLCIARVLADPLDTLALGSLLRGPLVGLSEQEMLDVVGQLPHIDGKPHLIPRLSLLTHPDAIQHAVARETIRILRDLQLKAYSTTPLLILGEAIERLDVRPILVARERERNDRAMANVDVFLELSRSYAVRGLKQFVLDVTQDWSDDISREEGRVDSHGDAIDVVTMHSAKGLEWPVVILINTVTQFPSRAEFVYRPIDDTLHWLVGDVVPPDLQGAIQSDEDASARERARLLYVAFTRAKDLLVIPQVPRLSANSWANVISDTHLDAPELNTASLALQPLPAAIEIKNKQTADTFAREQAAISAGIRQVTWLRPSVDDLDRIPPADLILEQESPEASAAVGAGRVRGLILHKMMEEVLTGELESEISALTARAADLLQQLTPPEGQSFTLPHPAELATTVARTISLPEVASLRLGLVPEVSVYTKLVDKRTAWLAGRADAVFIRDNRPEVVIDWKSDVGASEKDVESHSAQLHAYMRALKAPRGMLVYMSAPQVRWLTLEVNAASS